MKGQKRRDLQNRKETEVVIFDTAWKEEQMSYHGWQNRVLPAFVMLFGVVAAVTGCFLSAFSIAPFWLLMIPGMIGITVFFTVFFTAFFLIKKLDGYRLVAGLLVFVLYGGVCFWKQEQIVSGFYGVGRQVFRRINQTYDGNLSLPAGGGSLEMTIFLLAVLFPVTAVLAAGIVRRQSMLSVAAVLFPILAMTGVTGGSPSVWWLIVLVIGIAALLAGSRSCLTGWKSAFSAGLLACVAAAAGWFILRPAMNAAPLEVSKPAAKLETRLMQSLYQILPRISGGQLNLSLEGIGGGVEDGTLGAVDGYYFTGVEALKVTSEEKPQETVYLKGFVGAEYTGNSFEEGEEESFSNASSTWKTEGDASIYIQNLPFLRMMYYENYGEVSAEDGSEDAGGASADEISQDDSAGAGSGAVTTARAVTVENISANTKYTYVPYYAFLNDYYQVYGGDGYVGGQTLQDDIFLCYGRNAYQEAMEGWRDADQEGGVLDRVEESYRNYCTSQYLQIPEQRLDRLKKECEEKAEEENWNQDSNASLPLWARADEIEEIRQYVLKRLLSECRYELDVDALPEGEDFIETFLYETKEGYSTHFAAAATMMFRMFGVPARYVVGYAAPGEIFTLNEEGTYTAILQDDNAHAWTEIYQPFLGWVPVEVTPGMEGELTENTYLEEEEAETGEESAKEQENEKAQEQESFWKGMLDAFLEHLYVLKYAAVVLIPGGLLVWLLVRILKARWKRLGIGQEPGKRILALYRSMYRVLVLGGMPEDYTIMPKIPAAGEKPEGPAVSEAARFMMENIPQWKGQEVLALQEKILEIAYGGAGASEEDAQQMYKDYQVLYRTMRGRISLRNKIAFFLS